MANRIPFGQWEFVVHLLLTHPDAINCTVGDSNATLDAWYNAGFKPGYIAKRLNERYSTGFLERKAKPEQEEQ